MENRPEGAPGKSSAFTVEDEDRPVKRLGVFGLDGPAGQLQGFQARFALLQAPGKQSSV
jgi:hypothetical protein